MSTPLYIDETKAVLQNIRNKKKSMFDVPLSELVNLELDRCVKWIKDHNFKKIALQFPKCLLDDSDVIAQELSSRTQKNVFVLGDAPYGSALAHCNFIFRCCVDEVNAKHLNADAVIHFGHACLSFNKELPVLYIFGKSPLDVTDVVCAFKNSFPDTSIPVILYYEVNYHHAISKIAEKLKDYKDLLVSELLYPGQKCTSILKENQVKIVKNQRYFILPETRNLEDYTIFYIGSRNVTFINVMLCLNKCKFYMYNTVDRTVYDNAFNVNRFLRQRNYYIEKTRDTRIVGILCGFHGVSPYLTTVKRLRKAIKAANKTSYVFTIGKINTAKMANFSEVEVFMNIACLESTIVDCSGFYQPIITPYELEIALNIREFTDRFIIDFSELLPDGANHVPLSNMKEVNDVSLITGKTRSFGLSDDTTDESNNESVESDSALVQRDKMIISEIQAAGDFFSQRSWKGLEQNLGETPVADIQQGRKGIASKYEGEGTVY